MVRKMSCGSDCLPWILAPSFIQTVILDNFLDLFGPSFPHLLNGSDNDSTLLTGSAFPKKVCVT